MGGITLLALAGFVLLPAGIIALTNWLERRAMERLRREGVRCQVYVKGYRRVSMTQHRVLFDLHLPEGRLGREYMLTGLSDDDLANWTALQIPLGAAAHPSAKTIALDAASPPGSRPFFLWLLGASVAVALVAGVISGALHTDDEASLGPELRALCAALRRQHIDVANVQLVGRAPTGVRQRAWVELDGDPYEMRLYSAPATTSEAPNCSRGGSLELCGSSSGRTGYERIPMSPRVRAAFAASVK